MINPEELPELNLHEPALSSGQRRWSPQHSVERDLYSADNYQSYLVDSSGNAYDPYSLAWRYLGLYIDCDISNSTNFYQYYNYNNGYSRTLHENDRGGDGCERKLLWAAYVDTKYKGNGIEEYQFYDIKNGTYDDSTCMASGTSHRCVKLDCHESHTHFNLVGVFKETDGMYDWTEQLFKHEGYCIWMGDEDDDVYNTMETWMEKWPTSCKKLSMPDYYGNNLYISTHPLPEGNMTLEIYTDNLCTMLSEEMNLEAYILNLYNYYGYNNQGQKVAEQYAEAIETWNEKMSVYKICQPCRAYNFYYDQNHNSHDHRRFLENDGEGEEQERFNCYDDAGYTNVNQCYKFETKTQMEPAYEADLSLADDQGSILKIHAFGKTYGRGGYSTPYVGYWDFDITPEQMMYLSFGSIVVVWIAMLLFFHQRHSKKCKKIPSEMGDSFYDDGEYDSDDSDSTRVSDYSKGSDWSNRSDCPKNVYSPPTIELSDTAYSQPEVAVDRSGMKSFESTDEDVARTHSINPIDTADLSAKGCCTRQPVGINLSESEMKGFATLDEGINSFEHAAISDYSAKGCCVQDPRINFTQSEIRSFENLDDDDNFRHVGHVNYNRSSPGLQSDATTFETRDNPGCVLGLHAESANFEAEQNPGCIRADFGPTISQIDSTDSSDRSYFNTTSSPIVYIVNNNSDKIISSREEESLANKSANESQPDIINMNQSDMSSFESMNHRANRLQQWKAQQQQLAQNQTQDPYIQKLQQPERRALEKVEETDTLGDALLRVQQRIIESKQYEDSTGDEMTAASSEMSSIV